MKLLRAVFQPALWRFAWHDSRSQRKRLLLYMSAIVMGIAALVAIDSLRENVRDAIDDQARELLGADLRVGGNQELPDEVLQYLDTLPGEKSLQVSLSTMAYFPKQEGSRLCFVRAIDGEYPYYGQLETDPPAAAQTYKNGQTALVDKNLMLLFDVAVGDELRIGKVSFTIAGRILRVPGEAPTLSQLAPRVYIPQRFLPETGLIQFGSRVHYNHYYKLPMGFDVTPVEERLDTLRERHNFGFDTIEEEKDDLGRALDHMTQFLSLVGLAALLLGGIGVGSSVHVHVRQRLATVAVLRCLGATPNQAMVVYLIQTGIMGLLGGLSGVVLGVGVQFILPMVLGDMVPVDFRVSVAPSAVLLGLVVGVGVTLLFAALPLLRVRRVSPLVALRSGVEDIPRQEREPWRWPVYTLIALGICGLGISQAADWREGLGIGVALLVSLGVLALVAWILMTALRKVVPRFLPYVWRQGLSNLYRPQNQTLVLMLCLGLGTGLIVTLSLVQETLLAQMARSGYGTNPNIVLFNIQPDQMDGIRELFEEQDLPIQQAVPMVTMRLSAINERSIEEVRADPDREARRWALNREYRSTYRSELNEKTETLIAGEWVGQVDDPEGLIPVSVAQSILEDLNVELGDTLTFDVQGVPMQCRIASIREVDWVRLEPNFFVVFPAGVLEQAPHMIVVTARTPDTEAGVALQRDAVERFPNVSVIDLSLVLEILEEILGKIAFAIRFMSVFSIATGLVVLVASLTTSRYQRLRESVLLRTLGASQRQIVGIMLVEYLLLGTIAAAAGIFLAIGGAWGLAEFVFETDLVVPWQTPVLAWVVVSGLTVVIGFLNSLGIWNHPPLEVLRGTVER